MSVTYYVYYLLDPKDLAILYIGRSPTPLSRWRAFERRKKLTVTFGTCQRFSRFEDACKAELEAIRRHRPPHNKNLVSSPGSFGKKMPLSTAHKKKISAANQGKAGNRLGAKHTAETKAKMVANHKHTKTTLGRKASAETRAKQSAAKIGNQNRKGTGK